MASSFFQKSKTSSIDSLTEEKRDVTDTTNEHEIINTMSEISAAESFSISSVQEIGNSPRAMANSTDAQSDTLDVKEKGTDNGNCIDPLDQPDSDLLWSASLSTPSIHPAYTPAIDPTSKENLHGLGLKLSAERAKLLSRTGRGCTSLLSDVASLHDELAQTILKQFPSALESAAAGTPMDEFAQHVNNCIISFAGETQKCCNRLRQDVIRPWVDFSNTSSEKVKIYDEYKNSRGKCAHARKEALKSRQKYVGAVKDAEVAIQSLKKARATVPRKSTDKSDTTASEICEEKEEMEWEKALQEFGKRHGITRQCDLVAKALGEVQSAEGQYCNLVELENEAISHSQNMECKGLDSMQLNEEERIIFTLLSFNRFIQIGREALEAMSLDLAVKPLNLDDSNHKELPVPTAPSSLFMTPRRRTQSEDGPAINETRMLGLPDNIAELRDNIKSHLGRQSARLKTLKAVSSFNENLAAAIDTFASGLHARLENEGYAGKMDDKNVLAIVLNKNEGPEVLKEWDKVIKSISAYATNASQLANQIKRGNSELYNILLPAKRELKTLFENEEARWKNLCDAAKGETQAKMKHKQQMNDLQKAKTRLALEHEDRDGVNNGIEQQQSQEDDAKNPKANFMGQSMKMNSQMNKAMGKMFSVLPGGGEDVMNKMLKPEQRKAIMEKNLDEAKKKSAKASENLSAATDTKDQTVSIYETETEAALQKFKSNERYVWAQMQKSLENSVIALKTFRDLQHGEMVNSDNLANDTKTAALSDVSEWIASTETRVNEYRHRCTDEWKEPGSDHETGFFLQLVLEDSSDIKELVNLVINDNDADFGIGIEVEYHDNLEKPITPVELPDVPEDPLIKDMEQIFTKTLRNTSIELYYSAGWSEEKPLYRPWLEKKGSFDVSVSDWETKEGGFKHEWSGEIFPQRRVIKFKFKRTTHLYIGPPIAGVTQTQYCRTEGNDRCVTMMTAEMDGIPYSDVFAVEVRWSARRQGNSDIVIDAGMHVRFIKSSMFAKQIKTGTLTETKPIHLSLFETIKVAIASDESNGVGLIEPEDERDLEAKPNLDEQSVREESGDIVVKDVSPLRTCINLISNAFWTLPRRYQVLSGVAFFGTVWFFSHRAGSDQQKLEDLHRKVDRLNNELTEVKTLLKTIVHLMDENGHRIRTDEL